MLRSDLSIGIAHNTALLERVNGPIHRVLIDAETDRQFGHCAPRVLREFCHYRVSHRWRNGRRCWVHSIRFRVSALQLA